MMRTQLSGEPFDTRVDLTPVPTEETSLKSDFLQRLTSRKFLVWVGTVLALISQVALGTIGADAFIAGFVAASATYQVSEGVADHGSRT